MNKVLILFEEEGCNIEKALKRFMNDEELYMICLRKVLWDQNFEKLGRAISEGDYTGGFESAHALKGELANMELEILLKFIRELIGPLRNRENIDVSQVYQAMILQRDRLRAVYESEI